MRGEEHEHTYSLRGIVFHRREGEIDVKHFDLYVCSACLDMAAVPLDESVDPALRPLDEATPFPDGAMILRNGVRRWPAWSED